MSETQVKPSEDAIKEAKRHPNGWVYQIDARYNCKGHIPPAAIIGAWKVDLHGNIVEEFIPNPNYKPISEEETGSGGLPHDSDPRPQGDGSL